MQSLWNRLHMKLFCNNEVVINQPDQPQRQEMIQTIEMLPLQEQLHIFKLVTQYMNEFTPQYTIHVRYAKRSMKNNLRVSEGYA